MRPVYAIFTFGILMTPLAAQSESIPPAVLGDYQASCVSSCQETQSLEHCNAMCGCVADKMKKDWTMSKYEELSQLHAADPNDAIVKSTMDGMIAQCWQTVQTGG